MGTAGGVKRMEAFLDETFLVVYGDNLWHADFAPLLAFHRERNATATIATFESPNPSACGLVVTDDAGCVTRFQEKPPPEEVFTNRANAGVYVLEPTIFRHIPAGTPVDFARDIFPSLLHQGIIYGCPLAGYLQDTGTVEAYRQANWDVLSGATGDAPAAPEGLLVGPGAQIAGDVTFAGRNVVGAGGTIHPGAAIRESILWGNCRIGAGAEIRTAILGRNVVVGDGATVGNGAILADGVFVARGARIPPGARIEPGKIVE